MLLYVPSFVIRANYQLDILIRISMPLVAGSRLGPYEILTPLGAGGMGEVFRARDTRLSRDAAIKILPAAGDGKRFEIEARALAALNHSNIVATLDPATLQPRGEVRAVHHIHTARRSLMPIGTFEIGGSVWIREEKANKNTPQK